MRTKIGDYNKYAIYFDDLSETFISEDLEGKSYSALKSKIDDIIKSSQTFEPFEIEQLPNTWLGRERERIKVVSLRKDGAFTVEKNGKNIMLSKYDESSYMLYDSKNELPLKQLETLNKEAKESDNKIKKFIKDSFTIKTLDSFREKILGGVK